MTTASHGASASFQELSQGERDTTFTAIEPRRISGRSVRTRFATRPTAAACRCGQGETP
jgi:hypothetical protein